MSDLLSELVGDERTSLEEKKRLDREKKERVAFAKKDYSFFCRHYLSDYFFTDPADYQKISQ